MLGQDVLNSVAFDGWPAPDDILIELGRLMTVWAALESGLNLAIGKLSGYDNLDDIRPIILIVHSTFQQRLDNLASLCEQMQSQFPDLQSYKSVISEIKTAQTARNKYAHNMVVYDPERENYVIQTLSARGRLKFSVEEVSPIDIRRASAQTHVAALALHELITTKRYPPIWERIIS